MSGREFVLILNVETMRFKLCSYVRIVVGGLGSVQQAFHQAGRRTGAEAGPNVCRELGMIELHERRDVWQEPRPPGASDRDRIVVLSKLTHD